MRETAEKEITNFVAEINKIEVWKHIYEEKINLFYLKKLIQKELKQEKETSSCKREEDNSNRKNEEMKKNIKKKDENNNSSNMNNNNNNSKNNNKNNRINKNNQNKNNDITTSFLYKKSKNHISFLLNNNNNNNNALRTYENSFILKKNEDIHKITKDNYKPLMKHNVNNKVINTFINSHTKQNFSSSNSNNVNNINKVNNINNDDNNIVVKQDINDNTFNEKIQMEKNIDEGKNRINSTNYTNSTNSTNYTNYTNYTNSTNYTNYTNAKKKPYSERSTERSEETSKISTKKNVHINVEERENEEYQKTYKQVTLGKRFSDFSVFPNDNKTSVLGENKKLVEKKNEQTEKDKKKRKDKDKDKVNDKVNDKDQSKGKEEKEKEKEKEKEEREKNPIITINNYKKKYQSATTRQKENLKKKEEKEEEEEEEADEDEMFSKKKKHIEEKLQHLSDKTNHTCKSNNICEYYNDEKTKKNEKKEQHCKGEEKKGQNEEKRKNEKVEKNGTIMYIKQDLREPFKYKEKETSGTQGKQKNGNNRQLTNRNTKYTTSGTEKEKEKEKEKEQQTERERDIATVSNVLNVSNVSNIANGLLNTPTFNSLWTFDFKNENRNSHIEIEKQYMHMSLSEKKNYYVTCTKKLNAIIESEVINGIPDHLRGLAWQVLLQLYMYKDNKDIKKYQYYLHRNNKYESAIKKDINRTYPKHILFKNNYEKGQKILFNVLKAYSNYNSDLGYCQGMAFIVAIFILYMNEEDVFFMLISLLDKYKLHDLFSSNMSLLNEYLYIFDKLLLFFFPHIHAHLQKENIHTSMYASQWFITLFSYNINILYAIRIWDYFFIYNYTFLFKIALAIFKLQSDYILQESFEDILNRLKVLSNHIELDTLINTAMEIKITSELLTNIKEDYALQKQS